MLFLWDVRGLLFLAESPLVPGYFSRVFNAYKSPEKDKQISNRRLPNMSEFRVNGPSKFLPQGQQLAMLRLPRFAHCLRGSVTDRRDFYHQAAVTDERARTNMLPFSFPISDFADTRAWTSLQDGFSKVSRRREAVGDNLRGLPVKGRGILPSDVYPCFRSLFQGGSLGGLALVIDDCSISAEPLNLPAKESQSARSLEVARHAYHAEALLGSPEKDVVAETCFKAAGAEVRSCQKNVTLGFVPVGSPLAKRLALAVLSLRAACLPGLSAGVATRVAGNWVSVLQFRKCWSSLIDGFFLSSIKCQRDVGSVFALDRSVAQELVLLASIAPLVVSNVAVDYLPEIFATDASNQKGAIVKAPVEDCLQESLWLDADKRGSYTQLDQPFRALLRHIGEYDLDEQTEVFQPCEGPWKAPLL